jgi:hypothetical protein
MNEREELATVYAGSLVDAQLAQSALEGHGVHTALLGEHVGATYGLWGVKVAVRTRDAEAAREVLEACKLLKPH